MHLWGIDLGGTKIEGVIFDPAAPHATPHRLRVPTEREKGAEHIVAQVGRLVAQLEAASGLRRPPVIGIGTPGAIDPTSGTLKNSNTVCLNGRRLGEEISAVLGVQAKLTNDANCFALAEATLGAGRGHEVVIGLIMGTGVGGGLVVHGKVLHGRHGIAGEWGHNPICGDTTPCYCGRRGCVETVLSGPALEGFYQKQTGVAHRLPEIVAGAGNGDAAARATLERLRSKFGEAIAAVLNIVDPDAVVIGGGVGNIDLLYTGETRAAIRAHLFNPELRTAFLKPALGDSAGVFGAALLATQ